MSNPTTRLLTLLELLQARGLIGGRELAQRLEVEPRSVRRYITMLQELGIPIVSERGRHGGYRLRPGFKLPPLMFTEDEALALTLALLTARHLGLAGAAPAFEGALAKVDRVLPDRVRDQLRAVQETLTIDFPPPVTPPAAATVLAFSTSTRDRQRLRIRYQSGRGESWRELDPYGLVYRSGRWYALGWCHLRQSVRVFRLDRVLETEKLDQAFTAPKDFDAGGHLTRALASIWTEWTVEVILEVPMEEARRWISPAIGSLEDTPEGVLLRSQGDSLDWMALHLMRLPCVVRVRRPAELLTALERQRARIDRCLEVSSAAALSPQRA